MREPPKKIWDVVVLGGANTDYLIRGRRFPKPGQTVEGTEFLRGAGGKGANQAVAAARLGARVAFIGKVGQDSRGDELIAGLRAEGIETRCIFRDRHAATGAAIIMVDAEGEKQILTAPGANKMLSLADLNKAAAIIRRGRVLLMQFEAPMRVVARAAKMARAAGTLVVLDPAPPMKGSLGLLKNVDVLRPNSDEARALTGIKVSDRKSASKAANRLLKQGVRVVALQAGGAGNLIVTNDPRQKPVFVPKVRVKSVDATGAGDAFAGATAVGLAKGMPWREIGLFASAAAALATTRFGAQPSMPRLNQVRKLLQRQR